jgi:hypothetical protein
LPFRIVAEKDELVVQQQRELRAQRDESAKLKDQLVQAGLQHVRALKEAIAAGDAKVEEARKQFAEAEGQLWAEHEEETKMLQKEQNRNAELVADQASLDQMIIDTDAQVLSKCPFPMLASLQVLAVYLYTVLFSFLLGLFPESQAHAHTRVTKLRAKNAVPNPDAP